MQNGEKEDLRSYPTTSAPHDVTMVDLAVIVWKKKWVVIIIAAVFVAASLAYVLLTKPS